MNEVIFVLLVLVSANASFASVSAGGKEAEGVPFPGSKEGLYDALSINEQDLSNDGSGYFVKVVGGLHCERRDAVVYPAPPMYYACTLDQTAEDASAIYNALDVKETDVSAGELGVGRFEKSICGLSCTRSEVVYPGAQAHYSCELK